MGISLSRRALTGVLAAGLLAAAPVAIAVPRDASPESQAVRAELSGLLRDLEAAASAADAASVRWMALRLRVAEARAAEAEARRAFETRVLNAYVAGPGRAAEFLLSSSDLHEFATRLKYAASSLGLGRIDVREVAARRGAVEEVLGDAERAQRAMAGAEKRLAGLRAAIERRLARAEASARAAGSDDVRELRKRYRGTLDRVSGATRTIRRQRGEAMFAAAAPYLGPRADCSIPRGLRSTGDTITGGTSWYGDAFRGKPTASGALFWPERFTVAHRTLPFGLFLLVKFRGKCVVAFLNDRGPYVDGRILDLSHASAQAIGLSGVKDVSATLLVRAS